MCLGLTAKKKKKSVLRQRILLTIKQIDKDRR